MVATGKKGANFKQKQNAWGMTLGYVEIHCISEVFDLSVSLVFELGSSVKQFKIYSIAYTICLCIKLTHLIDKHTHELNWK